MAKIDKIKQALKEVSPEDKLHLWNLRCSEGGYADDEIYENDEEFFNMFFADKPMEAARAAIFGDYNFSHDYVTFNGYANLQSIEADRLDKFVDDKEIAEFLLENEEYLDELEVEDEEKNEVSEEEYWDNLEVLPPYYFDTLNGKPVSGGFAVGEPTNHVKTPMGYRATYQGYYKKGDKYFGVGLVYFVVTDEDGEPDGYSDDSRKAITLNPDAFAKGGGIFRSLFSNREYSTGRNWTNDHRHQNKSEKWEVPTADRKRRYATGGGLGKPTYIPNADIDSLKTTYGQTIAGKKLLDGAYATGKVKKPTMARTQFEEETYEYAKGGLAEMNENTNLGYSLYHSYDTLEEAKKTADKWRKDSPEFNAIVTKDITQKRPYNVLLTLGSSVGERVYAKGGGLGKPTYIPNADIDSLKTTYGQTIAGKKLLDGAYATGKVKKPTMSRTQFEEETYEYGTGGTMDSSTFKKGGTPKQPIAFESSNLYFNGFARDINGNSVIRLSFPSGRAFSFQLNNGGFPITYKAFGQNNFSDVNESEINAYVKAYGSPAQKKKLKIYKK